MNDEAYNGNRNFFPNGNDKKGVNMKKKRYNKATKRHIYKSNGTALCGFKPQTECKHCKKARERENEKETQEEGKRIWAEINYCTRKIKKAREIFDKHDSDV